MAKPMKECTRWGGSAEFDSDGVSAGVNMQTNMQTTTGEAKAEVVVQ